METAGTSRGGIRTEVRPDRVGVCCIDSPQTRNALSPELLDALAAALTRLADTDRVRVIALVGGEDVFATGADARTLATAEPGIALHGDFWERFDAIDKPIVAGVSGWALGTGCELAFACDIVVASKTARFGQPEVALGLIPSGGVIQRLTRSMGRQLAMELVLTGRHWSAELSQRYGLVNEITDRRRWLERAIEFASVLAERAPIAQRLAKRAVNAAEREDHETALEIARSLLAEAMATEDRVEGVNAFLEKRPPKFEGR